MVCIWAGPATSNQVRLSNQGKVGRLGRSNCQGRASGQGRASKRTRAQLVLGPCKQDVVSSLHTSPAHCFSPQAGIIGISATAASRNISHTFSFAFTLAILTNLIQFMVHKAAARR